MSQREFTVCVTFGNGDKQHLQLIADGPDDLHRRVVNHIHMSKDKRRHSGIRSMEITNEVVRYNKVTRLQNPVRQLLASYDPLDTKPCRKRRTLEV